MAEGQGTTLSATQDKKGGAPVQDNKEPWYNAPANLGNAAGTSIQKTLAPVGEGLGKSVETVVKPVGGVVDGVVGGVMRSGQAVGTAVGVGGGNTQGQKGAEGEGVGGKEQTGENPLGL